MPTAEALTLWTACAAVDRHEGLTEPPWSVLRREEKLRQGGWRWDPAGHGRPRIAARR